MSNDERPIDGGPCPRCDDGTMFVHVYRANADALLECNACAYVPPADVPRRNT